MFKQTFIFIAAATLAAAASAQGRLPVPSVEYQAERVMENSAGSMSGRVYFSADKERTETEMGGMQTVTIIRRDPQADVAVDAHTAHVA